MINLIMEKRMDKTKLVNSKDNFVRIKRLRERLKVKGKSHKNSIWSWLENWP